MGSSILLPANQIATAAGLLYTGENLYPWVVPWHFDIRSVTGLTSGYYRFPTIHDDRIVFVAADDLFEVARDGGVARRLTTGLGSITRPHFSPDGEWIAFTGKEEGDTEVYVMPSRGGDVRRLTYLGAGQIVVGWHPDGRIIFSTYQGNPFLAWRTLYAISKDGGEPERLPYGRASWISFGPQGALVLGRPTTDSAYWKRYRGGTRGMLWIDENGQGAFHKFALDNANIVTPQGIGDRIYFIADLEDHGNLYSMHPDGSGLTRLTDHQDYYARSATTDGHSIVYHAGGDIYRFDVDSQSGLKVPIEWPYQRSQRQIRHVDAATYWSEYALDANGNHLALTTRGKVFDLAPFEGPVTAMGTPQGVRYRLTTYLAEKMITVSDEGGEDHLEIHALHGLDVTRVPGDFGILTELKASPDGQFAAFANERQELWTLDLKTLKSTRIAHTPHGRIPGFDWSPDGRWIAFALPGNLKTPLYLYEMASGQTHQITDPVLQDRRPTFDPSGQYLYFLSRRLFNPVWDNMKFDLSFPQGEIPCLIPLAQTTRSPFIPEPRPLIPAESPHEEHDEAESHTIVIDLQDIQQRTLTFPVEEGLYHDIVAGISQVFWTKSEPAPADAGGLSAGPPPATAKLIRYDMKEHKEDTVFDKVSSFTLSADRKVLAIRSQSTLRVIKASDKVENKDKKPGRASGIVDLGRIHVTVEPLAEWYQMQREAWRWMREMFWVPDMGGVDWQAVYDRYRRLIPRIATRSELSDIIWEMQGELGSSHAYEFGGEYRHEPHHLVSFLGASYAWDAVLNGYRITDIVQGDPSDVKRSSPLLTPGIDVHPGDLLLAINGQPLGPDLPPGSRLIDYAHQDVELTLQGPDGPRTATVRPLGSEIPLRYRQWVDSNRAYVHEKTQGQVGYIHIPNMGAPGFAEFHRGYLQEYDRAGLIIDVRYNGGGIVSPLLLEMLARRRHRIFKASSWAPVAVSLRKSDRCHGCLDERACRFGWRHF